MNKAFTNNSRIDLDSKHYIESDGDNGIVLTFFEPRQKKNKKTEEMEDYVYEEQTFHPRIVQALKHFVDKTQNKCETLEKLIYRMDYNTQLLEKLDKTFKQFN